MSILFIYIVLGVLFDYYIEKRRYRYLDLDWGERILIVILWPAGALLVLSEIFDKWNTQEK